MRIEAELSESERVVRLYRRYGPAVYRRCLRLLHDREAARDATQEVFVKVLRDAGKLREPETALPWIYRVATNHCLNALRDDRRHGRSGVDPVLQASGSGGDALPHRLIVRRVLARFDEQTQAIAVGVLVDGMEHEEVAGVLGISRRTVHRKLKRFLEAARVLAAGEPG